MTTSLEQTALESWWDEDPEMRHVEILSGEKLRICVRLFQIHMDGASFECGERMVAEFEAGTLIEAIRGAVAKARKEVLGVQD